MAASQYHCNTINREYSRFYSIQILLFKKSDHFNSKSNENFLNIEVHGLFFINFCSACFLRTEEIV